MSNENVDTGGTSVGISHSKRGITGKLVEGSSTGIRSVTAIGSNGNERRIPSTKDGISDERRSSQSRELINDNRINGATSIGIGNGYGVCTTGKCSDGIIGTGITPKEGIGSRTTSSSNISGSIRITRGWGSIKG